MRLSGNRHEGSNPYFSARTKKAPHTGCFFYAVEQERDSNPVKADAENMGVLWTADRHLPRSLRRGESSLMKRRLRGIPPSPPDKNLSFDTNIEAEVSCICGIMWLRLFILAR